MARNEETIVRYVDDIDGTELNKETVNTVEFAVDRQYYRIDLSAENKERFEKALAEFVGGATKVGRVPAAVARGERVVPASAAHTLGGSSQKSGTTHYRRQFNKRVRAWADEQGIEHRASGPLGEELMAKYEAAHPGDTRDGKVEVDAGAESPAE